MQDIGQLPEFEVVRLLEHAHQQLRAANCNDLQRVAVDGALSAVNSALEAKHHSSTDNACEHAEQLRRAAHALNAVKDAGAQSAMLDMLMAADMSQ